MIPEGHQVQMGTIVWTKREVVNSASLSADRKLECDSLLGCGSKGQMQMVQSLDIETI